jgi:hypothetical protein
MGTGANPAEGADGGSHASVAHTGTSNIAGLLVKG